MSLITHESLGIRVKKVGRAEREETERILKLRLERFMKWKRGASSGSSINKPVQNQVSSSNIEISKAGGTAAITNTGASILSVGSTGYSFDGKLLAEYNGLGEGMRDYIYLGDGLLAEYQPESGQVYYYTSDQVNSTRVVTDRNGVGIFASVYDPYRGIQKIWENSYSPAMKFSGKERDSESNLDYFGACYYGNYYYRWLSPDPVINKDAALTNPQLWNLYAFCHNNPVTYWDPDGSIETSLTPPCIIYDKNRMAHTRFRWFGDIKENVSVVETDGKYAARFKYHAFIVIFLYEKNDAILEHEKHHAGGYEWLYGRNVEQFKEAETRTFESKEEALRFGIQFFEKTVKSRPFKWRLYDSNWPIPKISINFWAWYMHNKGWEKCAQKKDWN